MYTTINKLSRVRSQYLLRTSTYFMFEVLCIVKYMSTIIQQDAHNNIQFIYICKLLYMFRGVTPLIIRSSYHCICSICHY
jgi:hypothetical protein